LSIKCYGAHSMFVSVCLISYRITQVARLDPEKSIPHAVLSRAKGLAIITVAKAGALLSYKLGTGLVISRRPDGSWSAPSAILSVGLGWGAQVNFIFSIQDMHVRVKDAFSIAT